MDPITASKVKFVSEKELAQIIPKTSLPTDLGGESTFDFAGSYVYVADRPPTLIESQNVASEVEPETPKKKKKKRSKRDVNNAEATDTSSSSMHDDILDLEVA